MWSTSEHRVFQNPSFNSPTQQCLNFEGKLNNKSGTWSIRFSGKAQAIFVLQKSVYASDFRSCSIKTGISRHLH